MAYPGLVGGHCIGVDPYYLTFKAERLGYHPQVILAARRINDGIGKVIAERTVKELIADDRVAKGAGVPIIGLTFKENVPDRGRNALSWEEKFEWDVCYVETRSFWRDLKILLWKTRAVVCREGISARGEVTMPEFKPTSDTRCHD